VCVLECESAGVCVRGCSSGRVRVVVVRTSVRGDGENKKKSRFARDFGRNPGRHECVEVTVDR